MLGAASRACDPRFLLLMTPKWKRAVGGREDCRKGAWEGDESGGPVSGCGGGGTAQQVEELEHAVHVL